MKYIKITGCLDGKTINTVGKVYPETNNCWYDADLVFATPINYDMPRIFDIADTEYITEKEYFKGVLSG